MLEFAGALRIVDRAHSGANRRRLGLDVQTHDLKSDPGADAVIVARRIAASVQIDAGGDGSLDERFTQAILAEDNQRNGTINARAAPRVFSDGTVGRADKRRLAHVCSK